MGNLIKISDKNDQIHYVNKNYIVQVGMFQNNYVTIDLINNNSFESSEPLKEILFKLDI